jgi:hypothetical protein
MSREPTFFKTHNERANYKNRALMVYKREPRPPNLKLGLYLSSCGVLISILSLLYVYYY